ncbi:uncharacterized protein DNG_01553 [Cephalotrichum gorgonifer]|uniref:non-specific serine/threonine protein kinase n=1 Tax=Cephalotrichum gorgonifer TaxID=2041049 RepID=A0AAE8SSC0_9PEZI|nr:uncharacterized protein DNG_01553 [Cephalotrichum gorgonifer]
MSKPGTVRQYGKQTKRSRAERLFAELPQSPLRRLPRKKAAEEDDGVGGLSELVAAVKIDDEDGAGEVRGEVRDGGKVAYAPKATSGRRLRSRNTADVDVKEEVEKMSPEDELEPEAPEERNDAAGPDGHGTATPDESETAAAADPPAAEADAPAQDDGIQRGLRVLSWDDVCAFPDTITKIAEASYAEVYRVTNPRGTSIIKVIRLTSPVKPQTAAQERSGLVDEEPHEPGDLLGELRVSEWLADVPGFVVYKDRYVVGGKAPKALVETHRAFHRRVKRKDPDRLQFYPSPSRYLEETKFLVVELGDAGTALEDFRLERTEQVWDIFLHVAIALARAEDLVLFEHRDLHEGNLCVRKLHDPKEHDPNKPDLRFGYSGLDITILDYGLSRGENPYTEDIEIVAYDLERDLSIFTSTHAAQCAVYRRMRSFLLRGDRKCLPPRSHATPYAAAFDGHPISWEVFAPYTNVLWLAYIYEYLTGHFSGEKKEMARFKRETKEMWGYLDPGAKEGVPCFGSAGDVVRFAVESGWVSEGQVVGEGSTILEREDSIIVEEEDGAKAIELLLHYVYTFLSYGSLEVDEQHSFPLNEEIISVHVTMNQTERVPTFKGILALVEICDPRLSSLRFLEKKAHNSTVLMYIPQEARCETGSF